MMWIDLNADVGEGMTSDEELFRVVTSANIACGGHAGSPETIQASVRAALANRVAIGAHPGFADREHFGRRVQVLSSDDVRVLMLQQVWLVQEIAAAEGGRLVHVKPHGALYNMSAADAALADAIAGAVREIDPALILVGLAGSELVRAGQRFGLRTANEAFADRRYQADGSLVSRTSAHGVIDDDHEAVKQATMIVSSQQAPLHEGGMVRVEADTICVHGDRSGAPELARLLVTMFTLMGVEVAALGWHRPRT